MKREYENCVHNRLGRALYRLRLETVKVYFKQGQGKTFLKNSSKIHLNKESEKLQALARLFALEETTKNFEALNKQLKALEFFIEIQKNIAMNQEKKSIKQLLVSCPDTSGVYI